MNIYSCKSKHLNTLFNYNIIESVMNKNYPTTEPPRCYPMDMEIFERINNLTCLTPTEKVEFYYNFMEQRANITRQVVDQGLPVEERSYSFTGLGLKRKA